jgi:hypothetical protein
MPFYKSNYHSGMIDSPTINGTVGSGIGFLDCVLLTGFNVKSVSNLSRTGTTCNMTTSTPHGFLIGDIIGVYGADSTWNNLYQVDTVPDSTHLTFETTGTPSSPASGTITVKYPPLGSTLSSGNLITTWSKVFTGTNQAIYRSLDITGTQWFLRVDDSNTKWMVVSILEGYTTFTTGLLNQQNVYWGKSSTADSTARPWQIVGDSKRFYHGIRWSNDSGIITKNSHDWSFFGDILTDKPGDAYHCGIIGNYSTDLFTSYPQLQGQYNYTSFCTSNSSTVGSYLLRKYDQLGPQVSFGRFGIIRYDSCMGYSIGIAHPNLSNSGTYLDQQLYVYETTSIRGRMPGMYSPINNIGHNFLDRDSSVIIDGHQFMYFRLYSQGNGGFFLDATPDIAWSL